LRRRRDATALAIAASILALCLVGGATAAGERVSGVRLEGNRRGESDAISGHINAVVGGELDRTVIDRDIRTSRHGLLRQRVGDGAPYGGGVDLAYHVAERVHRGDPLQRRPG
jgi:hypothetical protein